MSMTPETRLDVPVEVRAGGHWWPGFLEHRRQRDGAWQGFVRWSEGPGMNRIGWFDFAEQLRKGPAETIRGADSEL